MALSESNKEMLGVDNSKNMIMWSRESVHSLNCSVKLFIQRNIFVMILGLGLGIYVTLTIRRWLANRKLYAVAKTLYDDVRVKLSSSTSMH